MGQRHPRNSTAARTGFLSRWLAQRAIAAKLAAGFGLVLLLMGGALTADVAAGQRQNALSVRLTTHLLPARSAARDIVTWVRAADDDGAWYVMARQPAQAAALLRTYYGVDVPAVHDSVGQALARADTATQRQALRHFTAFYDGTGGYTVAQRRLLDRRSYQWGGANGYLAGNEAVFALKRAGRMQAAYDGYVAVPFVPSLRAAQAYIDVVEREVAQVTQEERAAAQQTLALSVTLGLLALALGSAVAYALARSIARPLGRLTGAARRLAAGDTAVEETLPAATGGEIGALNAAFRVMVARQQELAEAAATVAAGDLTRAVVPTGASDTLGHAVATMTTNMGALIGQVAASSEQVARGADQVARTAEQIGQASTQVATAITEVARGAADQSQGAAAALGQMDALSTAVSRVALSAEAQLQAAERASAIATAGSAAVAATIVGMEAVSAGVAARADQVEDLSRRVGAIGGVVDTIEDIAAQTNLLALNAAIEAARAGEQGRGFAVVAAEVRTLAARTSTETTVIAGRIRAIQQQTAEVAMEMRVGSVEARRQAERGAEAREALEGILGAIAETAAQAHGIDDAVGGMRAGTERVGAAIESIVAVSAQSAAGAEEVSAATEEQAAGVHEMAGGARRLAGLAQDLQGSVARFRLEEDTPPREPVRRRRAEDWSRAATSTPDRPSHVGGHEAGRAD